MFETVPHGLGVGIRKHCFLSLIVSNILLRGYGHGKLKHMVDVDAMTR